VTHDPLFEFEHTSLERLKLAAEVILAEVRDYSEIARAVGEPPESARCDDLIPSPLEAELVIFKERIETALLLPRDAGWESIA
jgi:hypothetical protein